MNELIINNINYCVTPFNTNQLKLHAHSSKNHKHMILSQISGTVVKVLSLTEDFQVRILLKIFPIDLTKMRLFIDKIFQSFENINIDFIINYIVLLVVLFQYKHNCV